VLVRLDPLEEASPSGAILWSHAEKDKQTTGTLLAAGPGYVRDDGCFVPTTLAPGQRVRFTIRPGTEMSFDGVPHVFCREFSSPRRYPGEGLLAVEEPGA
jgi:chaperonin GroES